MHADAQTRCHRHVHTYIITDTHPQYTKMKEDVHQLNVHPHTKISDTQSTRPFVHRFRAAQTYADMVPHMPSKKDLLVTHTHITHTNKQTHRNAPPWIL